MSRAYGTSLSGSFGFDRDIPPVAELVGRVARRIFPSKVARNLSARTRKTHRAAEDWLSGRTGMNADALADVLRSDIGGEVLAEIMRGSGASWWPERRADIRAHAIGQRLDALQAEIAEAKRELV